MTETLVGTPDPEDVPPGLAGHLQRALTGAHDALTGKINDARRAHVAGILDQFEADLAPLLAEQVQQVLDNPGTPEHLKALLTQVGAPEHFSSSLLIGVAVGAIIGPVLGSAVEPYVQNISNAAWHVNPSRPLSPDLLAASVLKTVLPESVAADHALESGISNANFNTMVLTAGNSVGLAELLLLWRRGQITEAELDAGLAYSNLNPRFYDDAKALKYAPPGTGEVIAGALKGHLSDADAQARLGVAGVDPANYAWLKATAGRPPGVQQMLELWNRGVITEADVDQGIAQSDVNDTYLPWVKELRHYFPPPRSVVPMLRAGAITEAQARQLLGYYGVGEPWQSAFITEASTGTASKAKELTQAQILQVYEARLITRAEADARLTALKLPAGDVTLLLDLADEKRTIALQNAGARAVGTKYVAHKMTKPAASTALASLGVPATAQADLFTVWDVERGINFHALTPAMIVGAFRRGQITAHDTQTRLLQGGVATDDLAIVVADGFAPTKPNPAAVLAVVEGADSYISDIGTSAGGGLVKNLTAAQVGALYAAGTIGRAEALTDLGKLGYNAQQAAELLTTFSQPTTPIP